ncbi:hypothetical protein ACOMHN_040493 [Nucella lapillus]
MACKKCSQNNTVQKTSSDGLSCVCQDGYRYINTFGGDQVTCARCAANQRVSTDGWECKQCADNSDASTCTCKAERTITVERQLNGNWAITSPQKDQCVLCQSNTVPNSQGDRCVRCSGDLKLGLSQCPVTCPVVQTAGGYCFPDTVTLQQSTPVLHEIPRIDGTDNTQSLYFEMHLRAAYAMCI